MVSLLEKFFKLSENRTNWKTEVVAGLTTFMTMAYILAVNPSILSVTGMDSQSVFAATVLASIIGTVCMGLAGHPFALAPGMGLNAYFAYTVVLDMGYSWQFALTAVLVEGIIFIFLSLTNVRESIFNAIPQSLKHSISAGIGLFIAFIGLQNAKIVVPDSATGVTLFSFSNNSFNELGITVLLALVGIMITAILMHYKVKGGIFFGIIATYLLGLLCQIMGLYVPNPEIGTNSLIPDFSGGLSISLPTETFMKFDFNMTNVFDFIIIMLSFLCVDMFDTLGTLIGVATKADMLDKDGKLPRIKGALLADSIATVAGACLGTSTTTTYVESASGVSVGGRTGLTAFVTAIMFLLALPLSPIFLAIPSFATAPALIIVGFMMFGSILKIDMDNLLEAIPAYICIIVMAFSYSISNGIFFGIIAYVVMNVCAGKAKKVHWLMYMLSVLFVLKFALL